VWRQSWDRNGQVARAAANIDLTATAADGTINVFPRCSANAAGALLFARCISYPNFGVDMPDLDPYALLRMSRAAADLGYYNLGKLLNAAAASLANRSLYEESLPKTNQALAEAVSQLEPALDTAGLDPQLLTAIQHAREIVAAGSLIYYDDAPPVWVCRVCGEAALRTLPDQCPHCGAGTLVFQFFPAAFYLEPEPVPAIMTQLARIPGWLDAALHGLSEEQARQHVDGAEGAWTVHEAAGHLLDTQQLIARRVELFMEHAAPDLNAAATWQAIESVQLSTAGIATEFRLSREAMLTRLRSAGADRWTNVGRHTEFGPVTLQQQCTYFAKHEQWHMAQITRMRRALCAHPDKGESS
jgi:uncharacterized damage-inducible protein DinB